MDGTTDGNRVLVSGITVEGLSGLEFRAVIGLIADTHVIFEPRGGGEKLSGEEQRGEE